MTSQFTPFSTPNVNSTPEGTPASPGLGNQTKLVTSQQLLPCGMAAILEHLKLGSGGNGSALSIGPFDELFVHFSDLIQEAAAIDKNIFESGARKLLGG